MVVVGLCTMLAVVPPVLPASPETEPEAVEHEPATQAHEVPIQRPKAARDSETTAESDADEPVPLLEPSTPVRRFDIDAIRARINPKPGLPPVAPPEPEPEATPSAESEATAVEETPSDEGLLVWGAHQPVARWKRVGLISSASVTVAAIISAGVSYGVGQRNVRLAHNRASVLIQQGQTDLGAHACERPRDAELVRYCERVDTVRVVHGLSVATAVVGTVSTAVFGILHIVRRRPSSTTLSRVRPTPSGVAVSF